MRNCRIGRLAARLVPIAFAILTQSAEAQAETVLVAVASNFVEPLQQLAKGFEADTGHTLKISSGSTGQLYAQIRHGAPFDVFLAADDERPRILEEDGTAVSGSRFTYAVGQLALWCPSFELPGDGWIQLKPTVLLAIANPELAPYGRAAKQSLTKLGVWRDFEPNIVYGQNIAQVFALVGTGNAECGLVARSQLTNAGGSPKGAVIWIDGNDHDPIRQDAVILKRALDNPAAVAFMAYLKAPAARKIIASSGYLDGGD